MKQGDRECEQNDEGAVQVVFSFNDPTHEATGEPAGEGTHRAEYTL